MQIREESCLFEDIQFQTRIDSHYISHQKVTRASDSMTIS